MGTVGIAAQQNSKKMPSAKAVLLFTLGVFLLGFFARFYLADFTKSIAVYMDELRYYGIARGIWQGQGIAIRNLPEDGYSKILYSLFISPAFAFGTVAAQTRAIAVINSLLVNSAVFPALLLARRCIGDTRWQMVLVALTALLPDMAYSMGYMSEVSALPLTLWVVLACWCALQAAAPRRAAARGALAGALSYLLYLNKEVALAYPIAFVVTGAYLWFAQKPRRGAVLCAAGGYAVGFAALLLLVLALLPGAPGASYDQTGIAYMDSAEKWAYLVYALLFNAATALIAFLYLPLAAGLFRFKALGAKRQTLYVFCLTALAVLVFVIAYSITVREDFGQQMPRQHIRYYAPLLVPFLALCLGLLAGTERFDYQNKRFAALLVGGAAALAIVCVLVFLQPVRGGFVDNTLYKYFTLFAVSAKRFWAVKLALCAAIGLGTFALFRLPARLVAALFSAGLALVLVLGNLATVRDFRSYYAVSGPDADNIVAIDAYLAGEEGGLLVLLHDEYAHRENLILDTYVTSPTAGFSTAGDYQRHIQENGASLASAPYPLPDYLLRDSGMSLAQIEYILLPAEWKLGEGATEVEALRGIFCLYRLEDATRLPDIWHEAPAGQ